VNELKSADSAAALRISVVIPTADRGELLCRCIESVLSQSLAPLELVIVDNGNADAVVDSFKDKVKVVRTAPRIGPGKARNIGALKAEGDYLAFLDDDDQWSGDYLRHVVDKLQETQADAVLAQLMRNSGDDKIKPYKLFPSSALEQRKVFFSNPGFGGQNLTIKRDVFLAFDGFDESMPASEDRDLAARLLLAGKKLVPQSKAVAVLCDHGGQRARHKLIAGNWAFLKKHWQNMTWLERYLASSVLFKRWLLTK